MKPIVLFNRNYNPLHIIDWGPLHGVKDGISVNIRERGHLFVRDITNDEFTKIWRDAIGENVSVVIVNEKVF